MASSSDVREALAMLTAAIQGAPPAPAPAPTPPPGGSSPSATEPSTDTTTSACEQQRQRRRKRRRVNVNAPVNNDGGGGGDEDEDEVFEYCEIADAIEKFTEAYIKIETSKIESKKTALDHEKRMATMAAEVEERRSKCVMDSQVAMVTVIADAVKAALESFESTLMIQSLTTLIFSPHQQLLEFIYLVPGTYWKGSILEGSIAYLDLWRAVGGDSQLSYCVVVATRVQQCGGVGAGSLKEAPWNENFQVSFRCPIPPSGYVSVGDVVQTSYSSPELAMMYHDDHDGKFAGPEGFDLVWRDADQNAREPVTIWKPRPPVGYVALGCVVVPDYYEPDLGVVSCVRQDCVAQAPLQQAPITKHTTGAALYQCSLWKVQNNSSTFLARRDHQPPPPSLAYTVTN